MKKIDYAALYTLRKDGRYQGSYTDDKGRHYVYDRDPEKLWHKLNDPKPKEVYTFREAADAWQREHWEHVSYKTSEAYKAPLRRLLEKYGKLPLEDITTADVDACLIQLGARGYSRRTVQMHRDILNMIFMKAIADRHVQFNPVMAVQMPRGLRTGRREIPDDEAVSAVMTSNVPFSLFAKVCLYSGLRRGEVLALEYEDIDRKKKLISVSKAVEYIGNNPHIKSTKTENGIRKVPLLDALDIILPEGHGYIFTGDDGELLTKMQYRVRWRNYCKALGFELGAQQLRIGYATMLFEAGLKDKDVQDLMGHSSIVLTRNIYTRIRQSRRDQTAAALNNYIKSRDV